MLALNKSIVKYNYNYGSNVVLSHDIRIEAEGYKAPEDAMDNPLPVTATPVIETISLQELALKTNIDDLKV